MAPAGADCEQQLLDLRLKKFIAQYHYLESELCEMQFAFDGFNEEFKRDFKDAIESALGRAVEEAKIRHETDGQKGDSLEMQEDDDGTAPSDLAKRLYKKLAMVLHPDKPGGSDEAFKTAKDAYRKKDTLKLLLLAEEAGVPTDGMYSRKDDLSGSLKLLETKIESIKSSLAYTWYNAAEDERPTLREHITKILSRVHGPA